MLLTAVTNKPMSLVPNPSDICDNSPYIDRVIWKNKYKLMKVNVIQVAVPVSRVSLLNLNLNCSKFENSGVG